MKTQKYILYFTLALIAGIASLSLPTTALADDLSLKITPANFQIHAKPPADVWTPFTIQNQSNQPVSLTIGYKPFDPINSQNGSVVFLPTGEAITGADKKIFQKMQLVDDNNISHDAIDLGPGQKERFRLRLNLPSNEPQSDYYFSLIFMQKPTILDQNTANTTDAQRSFSVLQEGIGLNVLLAVGNKEIPQGSIDTFSTPWLETSGPVPFSLTVHNSGNHFISPHGTITIKNMLGQKVGTLVIPSSVLLAGTSRTMNSNSINDTANAASSYEDKQTSNIQWPATFVWGVYTADLSLSLGDNGPVFHRDLTFVALPITQFLEILVVLAVITYAYLRVKRKIT